MTSVWMLYVQSDNPGDTGTPVAAFDDEARAHEVASSLRGRPIPDVGKVWHAWAEQWTVNATPDWIKTLELPA